MSNLVLLAARHYYPLPGAATNRLVSLVEQLRAEGSDVLVVTRTYPGCRRRETGVHGEEIVRVRGDSESGTGFRRAFALGLFPLLVALHVMSRGVRPWLIISDPPPTVGAAMVIIGRLRRTKTVYYYADSWVDLYVAHTLTGRALRWLVQKLENYSLARSSLVVAVTGHLSALALSKGANVIEVPNGVDISIFAHAVEHLNGLPVMPEPRRPYFLYAGNYGEAHGATVFAKAAELLWLKGLDFDLVYMGYGSASVEIESIALRHPHRLRLISPQPPHVAAAALRACVAAAASLREDPTLEHAVPVKALAAITSGAPLVYAGQGDFARVVEEKGYGLVSEAEPEKVAQNFELMLKRPWSDAKRADLSSRASSLYDNRGGAQRLVRIFFELGECE